jgi:hypothetical protein
MTNKTCIKCNKELPATLEFFNKNNAKKDGLTAQCKTCRAELWKEQYAKHGEKYLNRIKDKKAPLKLQKALCKSKEPIICKKCGTEYKTKEGNFYRRKNGVYMSPCIKCFIKKASDNYAKPETKAMLKERVNLPEEKEKKRLSDAKSYAKHREKRAASYADYRARPDVKMRLSEYFKSDKVKSHPSRGKAIRAHYRGCYRAAELRATPKWVDLKEIFLLYKQASRLTKETGVHYEVDHIVPLRHKLVSGLHVVSNLQILTRAENRSKSNRFIND